MIRLTARRLLSLVAIATLTFGTVGNVLADAANPDTVNVSVSGQTVTLGGTWSWYSHPGSCDDRWVGWAVDWKDPNAPGTQVGSTAWSVGTPQDNTVHTNQNCGSVIDGLRQGTWGSISHTYSEPGTYDACVLMYDIHLKNGQPKKVTELVAGGSTNKDHNKDNSAETNGLAPGGSAGAPCIPAEIVVEPAPGSITIVKNTVGGDGTFDFTGLDTEGFSIPTSGGTGSQTFDLVSGDYAVNEIVPEGWTLTSSSCTGENTPNDIVLGKGEQVTCTFTNTKDQPLPGTIIIEKQTNPDGSNQEFTFDPSWEEGTFTLTDGGTHSSDLQPGQYTIEEISIPEGWTLTNVTGNGCAWNEDGSVSITLQEDYNTRCIFTNTQRETPPPPPPSVHIPGIHVEKSASASSVAAGSSVTYTYAVTNTSIDALLTNITVSDDKCNPVTYVSGDNGDTFLQIGETWTYTCTTTLTTTTTNTVTATGKYGGQTVSDDAQANVTVTAGGAVKGVTGTPRPRLTLPPTNTIDGETGSSPSINLGLILLVLAGVATVLGFLTPATSRSRRRDRRG